jgi:sterol desaturase/sphingolipid hydroxylase (fatty acid hydroxylase superfamily)
VPLLIYALIYRVHSPLLHSNVRLGFGWLGRIITTPSFHHWHHANEDAATTNKNFSGLLPCFDWLFGTLHLPSRYPVRYGIVESMPQNYLGQLAQPFRSPSLPPASPAPSSPAPIGEKSPE